MHQRGLRLSALVEVLSTHLGRAPGHFGGCATVWCIVLVLVNGREEGWGKVMIDVVSMLTGKLPSLHGKPRINFWLICVAMSKGL